MDLTKEKPAVGAVGQYSKNGSYTTVVVLQNQDGDDAAIMQL